MGCGFMPHHWDAILAALKSGKEVHFTHHYAVWNETLQCGWLQSPGMNYTGYGDTIHGWDAFEAALLESICNDEYRVFPNTFGRIA